MATFPLALIKRLIKGTKLTSADHDSNMTKIEETVNALDERMAVSFEDDGKIKSDVLKSAFVPNGSTASRPTSPVVGQKYLDTDIGVELIYERDKWRTASGSPGDIKMVTHATLADALKYNPGWAQHLASQCRALAAAGTSASLTTRAALATTGTESETLTIEQIPAHTHTFKRQPARADGNVGGVGDLWCGGESVTVSPAQIGGGQPHNNIPPTFYMWTLVKE